MHAPKDKETSPLDASPNKDIMDTNDTSPLPLDTPTISILRRDYQAAAAPNTSPEFVKKYPTNRAMIDAVNNLLLETYHSYTGRARISGSGDSKRLVIHFNSTTERDACLSLRHDDLADLRFFLHDPQQLRTDEDLHAIQVTDIPFFIKKNNVTALFKKYGNIQSCCLHTHTNAKVQQARIVYDDASSIQHFIDKQWAIYCYSTCLHIMPCSVTLDRKKSRREFVAVLSQLPPNTIDVHLAPLVREIGAMAINISLSLNSYKPKGWAYITFKSQQMMDTAMEQSIALQGRRLQWEL
uniref:RRM domain-containing protein n=1 Tax=Rhizophagus irregularis (strain DAOM 181602 / DAOM 197198 / MUCL 43194) TaxID=747089 RepID=U9TNY1_RHIID